MAKKQFIGLLTILVLFLQGCSFSNQKSLDAKDGDLGKKADDAAPVEVWFEVSPQDPRPGDLVEITAYSWKGHTNIALYIFQESTQSYVGYSSQGLDGACNHNLDRPCSWSYQAVLPDLGTYRLQFAADPDQQIYVQQNVVVAWPVSFVLPAQPPVALGPAPVTIVVQGRQGLTNVELQLRDPDGVTQVGDLVALDASCNHFPQQYCTWTYQAFLSKGGETAIFFQADPEEHVYGTSQLSVRWPAEFVVTPSEPAIGKQSLIQVAASTPYTHVVLEVVDPDDVRTVVPLAFLDGACQHHPELPCVWTYNFTFSSIGKNKLVFRADPDETIFGSAQVNVGWPVVFSYNPTNPVAFQTTEVRVQGSQNYGDVALKMIDPDDNVFWGELLRTEGPCATNTQDTSCVWVFEINFFKGGPYSFVFVDQLEETMLGVSHLGVGWPVNITFQPAQPVIGQTVFIRAEGSKGYTHVVLEMIADNGVRTRLPLDSLEGHCHHQPVDGPCAWNYQTFFDSASTYQFHFLADPDEVLFGKSYIEVGESQ